MAGGLGVSSRRATGGRRLNAYVGLLLCGAVAAAAWSTPHHRPDGALLATAALATAVVCAMHLRNGQSPDAPPAGGSAIHVVMAVLTGPPGLLVSLSAQAALLSFRRVREWRLVTVDMAAGTLAGLAGWGLYSGIDRASGPRGAVLAAAGAAAVGGYEVLVTLLRAGAIHLAYAQPLRGHLAAQRSRWLLGLEMGCGVPLVVIGAGTFGAGAIALATGSLVGLQLVARGYLSAQARLSAAEGRLAQIVADAPLLVFATDQTGVITLAEGSPAGGLATRLGGLLGRRVAELPEVGPGLIPVVGRALTGAAAHTTIPLGDSVLDFRLSPLEVRAGAVSGSLGVAVDVTEDQRSEVSRRTRQRIADAVRGDPLQLLAHATAEVAALADELKDAEARRIAERANGRLTAACAQLQTAVLRDEERSSFSADGSLRSDLALALTSAFADTDVDTDLTVRLSREPLPAVHDVLNRVAVEAINNARKHAQPRTVAVSVKEHEGGVLLTVADDGVGLPSHLVHRKGHAGLQTMTRRSSTVGGHLTISGSDSGHGTVVRCWVPWPGAAPHAAPGDIADAPPAT